MNSGQSQKPNTDHSFSFEDVSKLFSLPLSEAADILGVPTSVLKKICNENGLERWPHRKYLAGKSIEEIKKEAAKEKSKTIVGNSPKNAVTATSAAITSSGSHVKDKSLKSAPEMKPQGNMQQPASKPASTWRSHHAIATGMAFESNTFDEFKYGFPSTGLSECTNKWWGTSPDGKDEVLKDDTKPGSEVKDATKVQTGDKQDEVLSTCDTQSEYLLSAVRKRALEEGKKVIKLHALKKHGAERLGSEEKILLRRLYQIS